MKALVGAFNQEKALVGAFSVIVQPVVEPMDRFTALTRITDKMNTKSGGLLKKLSQLDNPIKKLKDKLFPDRKDAYFSHFEVSRSRYLTC